MLRRSIYLVTLGLILTACSLKDQSLVPGSTDPSPIKITQPTAAVVPSAEAVKISDTKQLLNIKANQKMFATIKTNMGVIKAELFPDKAPQTVANFVGLSEGTQDWLDPKTGQTVKGKPLYSNLIFHRVIPDFMIQGGDPLGNGMGGPGYKFADEKNDLNFSDKYMLAMANSGPNTNGSQFFITVAPTTWLNGKHTIFGKVIDGSTVVDAIANTPTGANDKPVKDVILESVTITRQ